MNSFLIGKKIYTVPQCWDEVKPKLFLKVIEIVFNDRISRAEQLHLLFFLFTGVSKKLFAKLNEDDIFDLTNSFSWALDSHPDTYPSKYFYKNLVAPKSKMEFSSIVEFALAEQFLEAFKETQDQNYLRMFVATLCRELRPKSKLDASGDERIRVDSRLIAKNAERLKRASGIKLLSMAHFYLGCRKYIVETYPNNFENGGSSEGQSIPYDHFDLIRDCAKTQLFGNMEETQHANLHVIFMHRHRWLAIEKAKAA